MSQQESFSDHKAKYAAWRERMKGNVQSNKLIDLTKQPEAEETSDEWSADALFATSDDAEDDSLDGQPA